MIRAKSIQILQNITMFWSGKKLKNQNL